MVMVEEEVQPKAEANPKTEVLVCKCSVRMQLCPTVSSTALQTL